MDAAPGSLFLEGLSHAFFHGSDLGRESSLSSLAVIDFETHADSLAILSHGIKALFHNGKNLIPFTLHNGTHGI